MRNPRLQFSNAKLRTASGVKVADLVKWAPSESWPLLVSYLDSTQWGHSGTTGWRFCGGYAISMTRHTIQVSTKAEYSRRYLHSEDEAIAWARSVVAMNLDDLT